MKKLPYSGGTLFAVPLREGGGYALGLVTRTAPGGKVLLVSLFDQRLDHVPDLAEVEQILPRRVLKSIRIGDLGLINGDWPIIGQLKGWDEAAWPMPAFIRRDPLSKRAWRTIYDPSDPGRVEQEEAVPFDSAGMDVDALHGAGAVEILATKLLA